MKVAVDFDGTLADTNSIVTELMNFKLDTTYKATDVNDWHFWAKLGYDDLFWRIYDLLDRTHMRRAIPPTSPLACAVVKWLEKRGHEVSIVTSNDERGAKSIRAWLFGHGLDTPVRALGRISAAEKAALDFDVFIDDAPALAELMVEHPSKYLVLVDQPWNHNINLRHSNNVYRMFKWEQAVDLLLWLGL